MSFKVTCQQCQKTLKAPDKLAGKRVRCPSCQSIVQIPQADTEWDDSLLDEPAPPQSTVDAEPARQPQTESDQDFDWSQPLESSTERRQEDEFGNIDELPSLPTASPRRKTRKAGASSSDPDVTFVTQLGSEGAGRPAKKREKSKATRLPVESTGTNRGHWHWLLALAMIPLALSIFFPTPPVLERLAAALAEHPELAGQLEQIQSREQFHEFIATLPDGKLPGAHLHRHTFLHWVYALASAAVFLVLILAMFPGTQTGPGQLVLFGVLIGTLGILLLIAFQWVAEFTLGFNVRGRSILVLLFYIVKFIGFSYRCATDGQTGFGLSFLGFTCGVGLCEELCKALPIAFYLGASRQTGWRTACLIGLASGIGFGVSEGIMYSSDYYNGIAGGLTYLVRFASCVTLHAVWASSVALLMYNNQDYLPGQSDVDFGWDTVLSFVVFYLGIAMVLHGLYDTLLKQELQVAALAVAAASFGWWSWLLYRQRAAD